MKIQFIDRGDELDFLNNRYKGGQAEFIPVFGRRRVGKTELILNFIKDKPSIYFLSDMIEEKEQLKKISELMGTFFHDSALMLNGFNEWEKVFIYLAEKTRNQRVVFVIDEFPYLARINKAISSIFQKGWDLHLKDTKIFLILCGSSVGMMYREVLSYKAPLYGRRTGQIELKPMLFKDTLGFFPAYSPEDKIKAYSVLGGIPAYLTTFDGSVPVRKNIRNLLSNRHIFYNEPEFLIKEELREPAKYLTILKAIAFGSTKVNDISNYTGIERTTLVRYLEILESLGFIEKELSVTESKPHKSRKGLYFIKDEFFRFWFRFVLPFKSEIERGAAESVVEYMDKNFNQHIGYVFENICRQLIWHVSLPLKVTRAGRWWQKDKEIDIICLDEKAMEALFIECKWSDLSEKQARRILKELKEKSLSVEWKRKKEYFGVMAKRIEGKDILRKEGFIVFELDDLLR